MVASEWSFYGGPDLWRGLDIVSLEHSPGSRDWFEVTVGRYSHDGSRDCSMRRLQGEAVTPSVHRNDSVGAPFLPETSLISFVAFLNQLTLEGRVT